MTPEELDEYLNQALEQELIKTEATGATDAERYIPPETQRKLNNPPAAGQGLRHEWVIQVTLALVGEGWSDEEELIGLLHPKIGLDFPEREIRDAIKGALAKCPTPSLRPKAAKSRSTIFKEVNALESKKPPVPAPLKNKDVTPEIALKYALKFLGDDPRIGEADILKASHIALDDDPILDGLALLGANYKPTELLNLCIEYYIDDKNGVKLHGGGLTKTVEDWQVWIKEHKASPCKQAGCWYRHNPVKALVGTGNDGSYTDEEVSIFRYVVAESDKLPIDIQLALLARFELPIASIIDSAGKSVHAAVLTCCESIPEAEVEAKRILDLLIPMGFDPQNKNSSRFSRFPGARRHKYPLGHPQTGNGNDEIKYQRLLYLAPQADGAPMFGDALGRAGERPSMRLARQLAARLGVEYVQRQLGTPDSFADGIPGDGSRQRQRHPGEFGEFGVLVPVKWDESSTNSPNSPYHICQKAGVPTKSVLADYYDYAITQTEGADAYIMGAILPMVGAILARNVWTPWSAYDGRLYPNVYSILVGPPGNLKSTSIYPAESIVRPLLEKTHFLSRNYSPEALFDSFFKHPDRLLICSDAGSTIAKWANPYDGQRLSSGFLTLFDCEPMSEGFRRNRKEDNLDTQERVTGPLSLSIVFGSTLSRCQFDGNSERDGLQRRFLYHLALTKARKLDRPMPDQKWLKCLIDQFERLTYLKGAFVWDSVAAARFDQYKEEVERRKQTHDPYDEATQSRLSTLCVYALKIAMIFEATRLCYDASWMSRDPEIVPDSPSLIISLDILELAIAYVEECFNAAQSLSDVANYKVIREKAEILLANIRGHFPPCPADPGSIIVTRSQLTRAFADHPRRKGELSVAYLYGQVVPSLIKIGEALLLSKTGKKEIYAFRVES